MFPYLAIQLHTYAVVKFPSLQLASYTQQPAIIIQVHCLHWLVSSGELSRMLHVDHVKSRLVKWCHLGTLNDLTLLMQSLASQLAMYVAIAVCIQALQQNAGLLQLCMGSQLLVDVITILNSVTHVMFSFFSLALATTHSTPTLSIYLIATAVSMLAQMMHSLKKSLKASCQLICEVVCVKVTQQLQI